MEIKSLKFCGYLRSVHFDGKHDAEKMNVIEANFLMFVELRIYFLYDVRVLNMCCVEICWK